eukprot:TRINITY_DN1223_c0_g1_i1.p1 TRINITY_DN1223_c0_g1~~TRINITY_DN1223_c0_g1_i1.p1  ORF type:complete len:276 (+),score=55.52 TRINITY_DN1223_c0_g1_i1:90-917(+)
MVLQSNIVIDPYIFESNKKYNCSIKKFEKIEKVIHGTIVFYHPSQNETHSGVILVEDDDFVIHFFEYESISLSDDLNEKLTSIKSEYSLLSSKVTITSLYNQNTVTIDSLASFKVTHLPETLDIGVVYKLRSAHKGDGWLLSSNLFETYFQQPKNSNNTNPVQNADIVLFSRRLSDQLQPQGEIIEVINHIDHLILTGVILGISDSFLYVYCPHPQSCLRYIIVEHVNKINNYLEGERVELSVNVQPQGFLKGEIINRIDTRLSPSNKNCPRNHQ